jgi:hypothetical protein
MRASAGLARVTRLTTAQAGAAQRRPGSPGPDRTGNESTQLGAVLARCAANASLQEVTGKPAQPSTVKPQLRKDDLLLILLPTALPGTMELKE